MVEVKNFKWYELLGKISVYIFALSVFTLKKGGDLAVWMGLLAVIGKIFFEREVPKFDKKLGISMIIFYFGIIFNSLYISFFSENEYGLKNLKVWKKYHRFLFVIPLMTFLKTKKDILRFFYCLALSFMISIIKVFPEIPKALDSDYRIESFMGIMIYGHFLGLVSTFLLGIFLFQHLKTRKKLGICILYLMTLFLAILSKTRGMWIAIILIHPLMFFIKFRFKSLAIFLSLFILSYFVLPNKSKENIIKRFESISEVEENTSNLMRLVFWEGALKGYIENPVLGAGYYNTHIRNFRINGENVPKNIKTVNSSPGDAGDSHNAYISLISRFGIVGWFMIYFMFFTVPKKLWKLYDTDRNYFYILTSSIGAFYISGLTEDVITSKNDILFIILLYFLFNRISEYKLIQEEVDDKEC
jgi:O-antigen ligase